MVKIRLSRGGAKKRPFYHIIVTDERNARDGRNIERLGYFNPIAAGKDVRLQLDTAKVKTWCSRLDLAQSQQRVYTRYGFTAVIVPVEILAPKAPKPVSWMAEVIADSGGKWCGNALRFATQAEAEAYAGDLAWRWTAVRQSRVIESAEPVNYAMVDGVATRVEG